MVKTRVATRLKDAVGGKKSLNSSQDLVQLTDKYHVFVKRLQGLIAALKAHFAAMQSIAETRYKVRRFYVDSGTELPGESFVPDMGKKNRRIFCLATRSLNVLYLVDHVPDDPPRSHLLSRARFVPNT